jgi:hypothetical protein
MVLFVASPPSSAETVPFVVAGAAVAAATSDPMQYADWKAVDPQHEISLAFLHNVCALLQGLSAPSSLRLHRNMILGAPILTALPTSLPSLMNRVLSTLHGWQLFLSPPLLRSFVRLAGGLKPRKRRARIPSR